MSRALLAGILALGLAACLPPAVKQQWTLVGGTLFEARLLDSLAWRDKNSTETLTATVTENVTNTRGHVVIPAGSIVGLRIAQYGVVLRRADQKYSLNVSSVTVRGTVYPVNVKVDPVTTGVTRTIYRASRDVVVMPGTLIMFSLPQALTITTPIGAL